MKIKKITCITPIFGNFSTKYQKTENAKFLGMIKSNYDQNFRTIGVSLFFWIKFVK